LLKETNSFSRTHPGFPCPSLYCRILWKAWRCWNLGGQEVRTKSDND
jgi:hypothetical protein